MSTRNIWILGGALTSVLALVASWFLLISPQRAAAQELRDQQVETEQYNDKLRSRIKELKKMREQLPQYQARLDEIAKQMPEDSALPMFVNQLSLTAKTNNVTIEKISPASAVLIDSQSGVVVAKTEEMKPNAPLLAKIPVDVELVGDFTKTEMFLLDLQTGLDRNVLVRTIDVKTGSEEGEVETKLGLEIFVLRPPGSTVPAESGPEKSADAAEATPTETPSATTESTDS